MACIVMLIAVFLLPDLLYSIAVVSFVISAIILFLLRGFRKISTPNVLRLLSIQNPDLQYSADLLTQKSRTLSRVEELQKQYVVKILKRGQLKFSFPNKLKAALIGTILCFASCLAALSINDRIILADMVESSAQTNEAISTISEAKKVGVKSVELKIKSPGYVGQKKQIQQTWDVVADEGSTLQWQVEFYEEVDHVEIKFSDKSILTFAKSGTTYFASSKVGNRMLYELIYRDIDGKEVYSDFHKIDITYDNPPLLQVNGIDQFSEHEYGGISEFDIEVAISDDYGISDVYMIATIAQGTGESVMFREEKILLDGKMKSNVKNAILPKRLDLKNFGMQPGDELYFYVEARDNCTFKQNITRTETYIMSIRDTSTYVSGMGGGLGIDLMPEYFRSQRQIIIDTEKLLKNKSKLITHDFNSKSNELGFDQKTLRLKYGQFLGEEDESGIAIENHIKEEEVVSEEEGGEAIDALDGFRHDHDNEDEHNRVNEGEEQEVDPLEDFIHAHDSEEEATFFSNTLKGKLKAAMALMWDAELYLRLYQPDKSLPYQYKALKLIKEIKNHARVYVHRIGFDPPPIKEEVRLTGDLSEIKSNYLQAYDTAVDYPAIRKTISLIANESNTIDMSSIDLKETIQQAGNELAQIAIENPGNYIYALQKLRDWLNRETIDSKSLISLQNELIRSLPQSELSSSRESQHIDPLTKTYLQILEQKSAANE